MEHWKAHKMAAKVYDYPKEADEYYGNLENITKNNISVDYYPEGRSEKGFMAMNMKDEKIIEHHNVSSFAAAHVRLELKWIAKMEQPPKKYYYGIDITDQI